MDNRISVLVIDDSKDIHLLLKEELTLHGFVVYSAMSGKAGLKCAQKLVKKGKPDVILLDWVMPKMSGLRVLSELKYNRKTSHIPVFMLTAKTIIRDIDRAFDIGADDYITKPFSVLQIGGIIKRKLQKLVEANSTQAILMEVR